MGKIMLPVKPFAVTSKAVSPYPFEVGEWIVEFSGFLSLIGKVEKGKPQEIEEQATDAASTASDGDRPGTTIVRSTLLTSRAMLVKELTNFCKLLMCFSESVI